MKHNLQMYPYQYQKWVSKYGRLFDGDLCPSTDERLEMPLVERVEILNISKWHCVVTCFEHLEGKMEGQISVLHTPAPSSSTGCQWLR